MKKLFSLIIVALIATFTVITSINAATDNGKITIEPATSSQSLKVGETYDYYRIFDLESYSGNAYAYKINDAWKSFFTETNNDGEVVLKSTYSSYFTLNIQGSNYYISWKSQGSDAADSAAAKTIAEAIKSSTSKPNKNGTITVSENSTAEASNLPLGYYFVESSVGIICSLNTTNTNAIIKEKNVAPTVEKTTNGSEISYASIGDEIPFTVTLNNIGGNHSVVLNDTLSDGLTFKANSFEVLVGTAKVDSKNYTAVNNGQNITVTFEDSYTTSLEANTVITIKYSAYLNKNAVVNVAETNTAYVKYGNNATSESKTTKTYTYGFIFKKVAETENGAALDGAQFELYSSNTSTTPIAVVANGTKTINNVTYTAYRLADKTENGTTTITATNGLVVVEGLQDGTYYLKETVAPTGYQLLAQRVAITVSKGTENNTYAYTSTPIVNTTSVQLPSTGGIGTTLFITLGSLLVSVFGVMLIAKFRMTKFN